MQRRAWWIGGGILAASLLVLAWTGPARSASSGVVRVAPEFTHTDAASWINSPPLALADLRGHVVLIDIWTYDCWNCYRSFPWLKSVEQRFGPKGLEVIGVHSPEFEREKNRANVVAKVEEFGLPHPVMLDNDYSYWKALGNRYWPTYYLVDKQGRIRAQFIGETHAGTDRALAVEKAIGALLSE